MQKKFRTRCATLVLCLLTLILADRQQAAAQGQNVPAPRWWPFTQPFTGFGSGPQDGLDAGTIGSGLKEALRIGTQNAVALTGRSNGYFGNPAIRILMPQQLQMLETTMRMAGYGYQVDALIQSMNQAAERAAPAAAQIFTDASLR